MGRGRHLGRWTLVSAVLVAVTGTLVVATTIRDRPATRDGEDQPHEQAALNSTGDGGRVVPGWPPRPAVGDGTPFLAVEDATIAATSADATSADATSADAPTADPETLSSSAWPEVRSYLRFEVAGITRSVTRATVSLRALSTSRSGFEIYLARGWPEGPMTFDNAPTLERVLDSSGPIEAGDLVRLDVTDVVEGRGALTFAIVTSASQPVAVASAGSGRPGVLAVQTGVWCRGVRIRPDESIQAAVDQRGEGATFCLTAGVHRLQDRIYPKSQQRFIGQDGAILNGSKRLTSFRREGGFWIADDQTQDLDGGAGECQDPGYSGCKLPERVYVDGRSLWQVTSLEQLSTGEFFFDHAADQIYLANDPAGHLVETTVTTTAFADWSARRVVIRNLIVEKFGTPAQRASLGGQTAPGWVIVDNEVRNNSGVGICGGGGAIVRGNVVHHQGQMGLCGQHRGGTYQNNTVAYNNTDGFLVYWEAGGSKWVGTTGLTVRGNYVHHNVGMGLWSDIENFRTRYVNNRIVRNQGLGIVHEISYDAVIRDNFVARNGEFTYAALDGAGIMIVSSPNVEVFDNTVIDNLDGIALKQHSTDTGAHGPFVVENAFVHDNVILMCEGETGGIQDPVDDDEIFTSRNNRFDRNTYMLGSGQDRWWRWMDDFRTRAAWEGFGQDLHSRFRPGPC
jgi:hypothetical protein